jgi:hypothetical protein
LRLAETIEVLARLEILPKKENGDERRIILTTKLENRFS